MAICGLWPPQFIVAEGHNILEVTERLFMFKGFHGSLWSKATTFMKSQWRGMLSTLPMFKKQRLLLLLLPLQFKDLNSRDRIIVTDLI